MVAFVIVSGPPGSGKSTLAAQLASRLDLPLFSKDTIKEALMDALGVPDVATSRRLGAAAIETLLALARANGGGVLESNWQASVSRDELRTLPGQCVEVFCQCDVAISRERYERRASERHPGHFDDVRVVDDSLWFGDASHPVSGSWPVVTVDTSLPVDIDAVCAEISALSGSSPGSATPAGSQAPESARLTACIRLRRRRGVT